MLLSKMEIVGTSPTNSYQRAIGGGLFGECGRMYNYRNAGFVEYQGIYSVAYHTNEWLNYDYMGNNPVKVNKVGGIETLLGSYPQLAVCVSKP